MSDYTNLLRVLADMIEEHDLIEPHEISVYSVGVHSMGEDAPSQVAAWRRALGGVWAKHGHDDFITMDQRVESLPGKPKVCLFIDKDRCVRTVVGTEMFTIPAVEASPERVETRDIVEWDCEPILAGVAS